ncbi:MAG TPA: hypothetical protein VJA23_06140 [Candidatus Nanoarchaeia archaeon]|nr:hypothetical protein [Candidatus Nanoarchaeia archaeon]
MSKSKIILGIIGATLVGMYGGARLTNYYTTMNTVYHIDLNGDNLLDIVVRQNNDKLYSFLQQPDGTYKSLDEHFEFQQGKTNAEICKVITVTEAQIAAERETIDTRLKELGK